MFKVALVGHSQVPSTFEAPEGAEVRMVNITSTWFLDNLSTDGVHFNAQAKREIISKFSGVIHRCMA